MLEVRLLTVSLSINVCIQHPNLQDWAERCRHGNMGVHQSLRSSLLNKRCTLTVVVVGWNGMSKEACAVYKHNDKLSKTQNQK